MQIHYTTPQCVCHNILSMLFITVLKERKCQVNNKLKISLLTVVVAGSSTFGAVPALAANHPYAKVGFFEKIALMMGFKKNLPPEKRAAKIQQMVERHEAKQNARLDALVAEGKITEAQKTELKAKLDALEDIRKANAGKPRQEIQAATKAARDDLKAWAEANNLRWGDIMPAKTHPMK
jgi:hypothetical protein